MQLIFFIDRPKLAPCWWLPAVFWFSSRRRHTISIVAPQVERFEASSTDVIGVSEADALRDQFKERRFRYSSKHSPHTVVWIVYHRCFGKQKDRQHLNVVIVYKKVSHISLQIIKSRQDLPDISGLIVRIEVLRDHLWGLHNHRYERHPMSIQASSVSQLEFPSSSVTGYKGNMQPAREIS